MHLHYIVSMYKATRNDTFYENEKSPAKILWFTFSN